jgi:hypothetical protein
LKTIKSSKRLGKRSFQPLKIKKVSKINSEKIYTTKMLMISRDKWNKKESKDKKNSNKSFINQRKQKQISKIKKNSSRAMLKNA